MLGKLGGKIFSRTVELAKPVVNSNGATVSKLKKGSDLITQVTYGDTHRLAQKAGLKEYSVITKPDGQKVHRAILQNSAGDTIELNGIGLIRNINRSLAKGWNINQIFLHSKFMSAMESAIDKGKKIF